MWMALLFIIMFATTMLGQTIAVLPTRFEISAYSDEPVGSVSMSTNNASLARTRSFSAGLNYSQPYLVKTLRQFIACVAVPVHHAAVPVRHAGVGLECRQVVMPGSVQNFVNLGYAKQLGTIDLACSAGYQSISISGYGGAGTVVFGLASLWHLSDQFHVGFQVDNPVGGKLRNGQKIAYHYRGGMGYELSQQVMMAFECSKEEDRQAAVNVGLSYRPAHRLMMRARFDFPVGRPAMEIWFHWKRIWIIVSTSYHPLLGMDTSAGLLF